MFSELWQKLMSWLGFKEPQKAYFIDSQDYANLLGEAYMQINRAHIAEALRRGELEPIAEDIANLE